MSSHRTVAAVPASRPSSIRDPQPQPRAATMAVRPLALAPAVHLALAASLLTGVGWPSPAQAQSSNDSANNTSVAQAPADEARQYTIPAGPLSRVLTRFSGEAGIFLGGATDLAQGKTSPGLNGRYSVNEALQELLAGTGLEYRFSDADTVTLVAAQGDDGPMRLGPIMVTGQTESAYGPVEGYRASRSATATRTDTPIAETPVAVQKVPRQVIDDQNAFRVEDAIRNVSSVNTEITSIFTRGQETAFIRGFETGNAFRNGFPTNATQRVDLAAVENVEVLKGPASILFGAIQPGGLINYHSKRARPEFFGEFRQTIGEYDKSRSTLDVNGALTEDESLLGRVNLAYTDQESFRDEVFTERFMVAPTLTWRPTSDTEIIFDVSYSDEERPSRNDGVPFTFDGKPAGNADEFFNNPDLPPGEFTDIFAGYELSHQFTDNLRFRNKFLFHELENDKRGGATLNLGPVNADNEITNRFEVQDKQTVTEFQIFNDVLWKTEFAQTEHNLLVGVDLRRRVEDLQQSFGALPNLDVFDPESDPRLTARASNLTFFEREIEVEWAGLYFQDQITLLNDRLHVLLGGRYDDYQQEDRLVDDSGISVEEFTGRAGVLYELHSRVHPYASFSQSFDPTTRTGRDGDVLDPETGNQFEVGLKTFWFDDRLTATVAAFEITKEDVADDLDGDGFPENAGEQRSRGVEFDVSGEFAPGWRVIGSLSYLDTEVIDSASLPEGAELRNIPETSGSLWVAHDFQPGSGLQGFGLGAGVFFSGDKAGDSQNSFELDGYETVDIGAWYERPMGNGRSLRAQVNVSNLLDEDFFPASLNGTRVRPGEPRKIEASVSFRF